MFAWLHISLYFWLGIILWSSIKGNGGHSPDPRHTRHFYILYSLPPPLDTCFKKKDPTFTFCVFFVYFFWRARVCRPLLCLCPPFYIFDICLDSNPESCRSKQARYKLSHPPKKLAIHFCLSFSGTKKDHNFSFPEDRSFFFGTWTDPMFLNRSSLLELAKIVLLDRSFSFETRRIELFLLPRDKCLFLEQRMILIHFP
jgi:hypothetical protein